MKFILQEAMREGVEVSLYSFFNLGVTWGWVVYATHRPLYPLEASHKSNPSSVSQGYVDSYSTLRHVGGGNRCGVYTLLSVTTTHAALQGSGLPKPRWTVSCWRMHGTGVVTAVSLTIPLGNQAAPRCM